MRGVWWRVGHLSIPACTPRFPPNTCSETTSPLSALASCAKAAVCKALAQKGLQRFRRSRQGSAPIFLLNVFPGNILRDKYIMSRYVLECVSMTDNPQLPVNPFLPRRPFVFHIGVQTMHPTLGVREARDYRARSTGSTPPGANFTSVSWLRP